MCAGKVVRTFDHPLPAPWEPGATQRYTIDIAQSAMVTPLAPGSYGLSVGLYDVDWGYRWPILTDGAEIATREYRVATVEVPTDDSDGPSFEFGSGWLPAEPRGDRQVPMRRRLASEAAVRVRGLNGPGTLLFRLTVHDESGQQPVVAVKNDCDGTQRRLIGSGTHAIEIDVAPGNAAVDCVVNFRPRGPLSDCGAQCPVYLEQATFRPDSETND